MIRGLRDEKVSVQTLSGIHIYPALRADRGADHFQL
jgi:hypothetical protein